MPSSVRSAAISRAPSRAAARPGCRIDDRRARRRPRRADRPANAAARAAAPGRPPGRSGPAHRRRRPHRAIPQQVQMTCAGLSILRLNRIRPHGAARAENSRSSARQCQAGNAGNESARRSSAPLSPPRGPGSRQTAVNSFGRRTGRRPISGCRRTAIASSGEPNGPTMAR